MENKEKVYIAEKKVKSVEETDRRTPLGATVVKVTYADGGVEFMPHKRFDIIRTFRESDASAVYEKVASEVGSIIFGLLHEYGAKLSEIDRILQSTIQLVNSGTEKANNILWNIDFADQRNLLMVNDVLLRNAPKSTTTGGDEPASK